MTQRLAAVEDHIVTVRQLGAVVNAMRGIAGARAQQSRALLPAIRAYAETALRAIGQARALHDDGASTIPAAGRRDDGLLILFGAEQGFAGAYPDHMIEEAAVERRDAELFLIGQRAAALAAERGIPVAWTISLPSRADALPPLATAIVDALYRYIAEHGAVPVRLIHARWSAAGGMTIVRRSLLPMEEAGTPAPPRHGPAPLANLPPERLIEQFAQEYVFALLCEAASEAFAAENEVRAATMATAKAHIDDRLAALQQEERITRQEETTAEVVELAAGARRTIG